MPRVLHNLPTSSSLALPKQSRPSCCADVTACCPTAGAAVEAVLAAEADGAAAAASSSGVPQQPQPQEPEPAAKSAAASSGSGAQAPLDVAAVTQGKAHWLYLVHPEVPQAGQAATVLFNRSVSEVLRWGTTPAMGGAKASLLYPSTTHTSPHASNSNCHMGEHSSHACLLICGQQHHEAQLLQGTLCCNGDKSSRHSCCLQSPLGT